MITTEEWKRAQSLACVYFEKAGIVLTQAEKEHLEVADFGLGDLEHIGLQIITYINTERVCAKEMALFPDQICPEHIHPPVGNSPGKEETFRCRWGEVRLYVPGKPGEPFLGTLPKDREANFTVKHQIVLHPGEQYTLHPQTLHWFQAGPEGAVISEFSTHSSDDDDIFTDSEIKRTPEIK